jgi:hypothetical protein
MRQITFVLFCLLSLTGCMHDSREKIAMGMLYPSSDPFFDPGDQGGTSPNDKAFAGALLGRFPVNSPAINATRFLVALGGTCSEIKSEDWHGFTCEIPEIVGFCVGVVRHVGVRTIGDNIAAIGASKSAGAC